MSAPVPFADRRDRLLDKLRNQLSRDDRIRAGWLQGSLADGSADEYSDIDLYLCVKRSEWSEVWNGRVELIETVVPVLAHMDVVGTFGVGCLVEGPVKLDVFFERDSGVAAYPRPAVRPLWGDPEILEGLKTDPNVADGAIARSLETMILGLLQGGTWPVRILARGQLTTFLFNEVLLIETMMVPLMLLETDRHALHRNMLARAKLLGAADRDEVARMTDDVVAAILEADRDAMLREHLKIFGKICALARAAFARFGLKFPNRAEDELIEFYRREWPRLR